MVKCFIASTMTAIGLVNLAWMGSCSRASAHVIKEHHGGAVVRLTDRRRWRWSRKQPSFISLMGMVMPRYINTHLMGGISFPGEIMVQTWEPSTFRIVYVPIVQARFTSLTGRIIVSKSLTVRALILLSGTIFTGHVDCTLKMTLSTSVNYRLISM